MIKTEQTLQDRQLHPCACVPLNKDTTVNLDISAQILLSVAYIGCQVYALVCFICQIIQNRLVL